MQMIQEFTDIVALPYDPVNHISIKFQEWGEKVIRYAQIQNKPLTEYLLPIATQEIPHGKQHIIH